MKKTVRIMAILNVTPDSFSDGGQFVEPEAIEQQISSIIEQGADIIDVGGESTRPFADPVAEEEELHRVIPSIRMIRSKSDIQISIDTTKSRVAREALAAGATMINDISALQSDEAMIEVATSYSGPLAIMHMQGTPQDMQVKPQYENVVEEINHFFSERLDWLEHNGVKRERVILDPGIGFGKTLEHNIAILQNISAFKKHGCKVLIGHSRKSFFQQLLGAPMEERDTLTAIVSAFCVCNGADILRVHAVKENVAAVQLSHIFKPVSP